MAHGTATVGSSPGPRTAYMKAVKSKETGAYFLRIVKPHEQEPEVLLKTKMKAQRKVKKEPKEKKSKVVMPRGKNSKPKKLNLNKVRKDTSPSFTS